ncbi:DUF5797 family protein [Haloarchaeobius salinus]|uniref:DUF5797 family protein n=1 Tax=Haloarchaeobius salinus TaxID=1198298 RepID=UPI00210E8A3C|nr:DUF5797 family protein [Haloarchaeobius salinus]
MDIERVISQAEGQIDRQLLSGQGEGGLFTTGYLSDSPFYELLSANEVPHYLFASAKKAPTIDGHPQRDSLDDYRAITAVTSDRILYAVGASDGDITGEIGYDEIDAVDITDVGSPLRSKPVLLVETVDQEYRFYGANVANRDSLLDFIREQITNVYESKTRKHIADAKEALSDGNLTQAADQIDTAREFFGVASEWRELITRDADLADLDAEIDSLTDRLSANRTIQSVLKDVQGAIEDGDAAFKKGDINEAGAKYKEAYDCLDDLDEMVELNAILGESDINSVRSELRVRDFATTPTEVHRRLRDRLERARSAEAASERTSDPKQAKTNLEAAAETVKEYFDELQSANIGFAECTPEGQCDGCGRPIGVDLNIEIGGVPVSVCAPCSEFGDNRLLTEDEAEEYIEQLETKRKLTGPLPAAVRRINNSHSRTPTPDEVLSEAGVSATALQERYGSYEDLLDSLDLDPTSDLLNDLRNVADKVERQPTKEDVRTHGRYKIARFLTHFGDWESALQAAELNTTEGVNGLAGNDSKEGDDGDEGDELDTPTTEELLAPVREAANTLGRPPTYQEGMDRTQFSGSQYGSQLGTWNDVLAAANLDVREALCEDLRSVADEMGMTPMRQNLEEYATYPPRLYEDCFGSIEAVIKAAGFELVNTDRYNWIKSLRKLYLEKGEVPLPFDVRDRAPNLLDEIYDDVQTWDEALSKAGIRKGDQDDFAERLLMELQQVGEELGHQPSRQEFNRYGSLPVSELESHFDSFKQALSVSDLDLPSGRPVQGPLDEPPDASGEIPSHTDLLRELHWLVERKGRSDARERFEEIGSFDAEHYDLQFGSLDDAFDQLFEIQQSDTRGSEYAPRRILVDELSQFGEFLERAPTLIELLYYSSVSLEKFSEKFESLADIYNAAGFEYDDDLPSNEELLNDIQLVGEELGRPPTLDEYADHGQFDYANAIRRFDGWIPTLNAVGYDLLSTVPSLQYYRTIEVDRVRFESILRFQTGFGEMAILLDDLYRLQHQFGDELSAQLVAEYGRYPITAYQSAFGTVDSAISTIGLTPTNASVGVQILDQSLRTSFSNIKMRLGRQPTQEEVDALGEYVSITYVTRFSSWDTTLDECLESSDLDDHKAPTPYALLWELDRVAEKIGDTPNPGVLLAKGQYDADVYLDTFDSWQALYEAAGYEWEHSEGVGTAAAPGELDTTRNDSDDASDEGLSRTDDVSIHEETDGTEAKSGDNADASEELATNSQENEERQEMIDTLQDLYDDLGRIPLAQDIRDQTEYSQHDYTSEFGSLDDALAEAGYDKRKALLKELERVADELGRPPTTVDFADNAEFSSALYTQYFGSWEDTLEAAGVSKEDNDDSDGADKKESDTSTSGSASSESQANSSEKGNAPDQPSDEELLDELRTLDKRLETVPRWGDMNERGAYKSQTYIDRFGSWDDALEEAGVDKGGQLLAELKRVADELGRTPSTVAMNERGRYSASMYAKFFGSWSNAVDKLDRKETRTNQETDPTKESETPEKDALISELNRLSNETDGLVKATDMQEDGAYAVNQYTEQFGSWDEALDEAGIERKAQLLNEIEQVWEQLGRRPSTVEMNKHGRVSATTVTKYFDSWEDACDLADPNIDSTGGYNFDKNSNQNKSEESGPNHELDGEEINRLRDIVRLQPTKNAELKDQWGLESGSEVHRYLEFHFSKYYYRDKDSYIRATEVGESIIEDPEGGAPANGKSVGKTDLRRRDLILSLVELSEKVDHLPGPNEIKEQSEYALQRYQEEFGSLINAYKAAGLLPGDATKEDFHREIRLGSNSDSRYSEFDESEEDAAPQDDSGEIDDALKKKMLFDEGI